jgi:iron complex outermembrane receptor protein
VSAERRTESLQKTAVAVSVREGDELRDEGKFTVNQILEDVPSVSLQVPYGNAINSDVHVPNVSIRGVSSNGAVQGSTSSVVPAVAAYVDGVVNGLGATYDLNRIEVLRGPQGTLYGRSATGGVLNIHTNDPELHEFGGNASVEFGDYCYSITAPRSIFLRAKYWHCAWPATTTSATATTHPRRRGRYPGWTCVALSAKTISSRH